MGVFEYARETKDTRICDISVSCRVKDRDNIYKFNEIISLGMLVQMIVKSTNIY